MKISLDVDQEGFFIGYIIRKLSFILVLKYLPDLIGLDVFLFVICENKVDSYYLK
jgi:hypothetical protein